MFIWMLVTQLTLRDFIFSCYFSRRSFAWDSALIRWDIISNEGGGRGGRGDRYHLKLSEHNSYMFLFVWWFSNCSLSFLFLFLQPLGMGPTTMHIHIKGLPPNTVHGFHIHEYGDTFSDGTFAWSNTNKIVTNVLIACGTSLVFPRFSDEQRQAQGEHETNARETRGEREGRVMHQRRRRSAP